MPLVESSPTFNKSIKPSRKLTKKFLAALNEGDQSNRGTVVSPRSVSADLDSAKEYKKSGDTIQKYRTKVKSRKLKKCLNSSDSEKDDSPHKKDSKNKKQFKKIQQNIEGIKNIDNIKFHSNLNKAEVTDTSALCNSDSSDIDCKEVSCVTRELHLQNSITSSYDDNTIRQKKPTTPRKEKSRTTEAELRQYSPVTPTKQKRNNDNVENVLKSPTTPSHLLNKLSLMTEVEQTAVEDEFKPKKLFDDARSLYQNARKALHSMVPSRMPGRESELNELRSFIKEHVNSKTSDTLYISGPPGTGKTASLMIVLNELEVASELKKVYINCTSIKSSNSIFSRIVKELDLKVNGRSEKDYLAAVDKYLSKSTKMTLFVLDEIDQLESKKQSILYTIFEWPSKWNSNVLLIGIANALDLTDRILPRLQACCALKPKLMHFAPYSKQEIMSIFIERLEHAGVLDVISSVAIQMLAGKVAAVSGDIRRALDIGRRVIELVEKGSKHEVLKPLENDNNIDKVKSKSMVDLKQVMAVLSQVYGTTNNLKDADGDDSLPLQQKIVLCALLLILKKAKNKDITIGKLHEVYRKVCAKRNLLAIDQAEFVGLCSLIETRGIMRVTGKKEPRLHKVCLEWDQDEVTAALKDKHLIATILQDDSCLGKL